MTRETKIGLLFGLGVIVLFAVLLSHTGTVPPPGEGVVPILADRSGSPVLDGSHYGDVTGTETGADEESAQPETRPEVSPFAPAEAFVQRENLTDGLPAPVILNSTEPSGIASADGARDGGTGYDSVSNIVGVTRVAPDLPETIEEPRPTVRPETPTASADPSAADALARAGGDRAEAIEQLAKTAPPLKVAPPKEYVVKKRDTLTTIAKKHYGSSSPRFINLLVKSNEDRVKNPDTVIEGQKLLIPDLPPEMFENAPGFDVTVASGRARGVSMEEVLSGAARKAPAVSKSSGKSSRGDASGGGGGSGFPGVKLTGDSAAELDLSSLVPVDGEGKRSGDGKNQRSAPSKSAKPSGEDGQLYRYYEVKQNDTLAEIARKHLGSADRWQEIKELNRGIDPRRMKVGEKLRLPRRSQSQGPGTKRASA